MIYDINDDIKLIKEFYHKSDKRCTPYFPSDVEKAKNRVQNIIDILHKYRTTVLVLINGFELAKISISDHNERYNSNNYAGWREYEIFLFTRNLKIEYVSRKVIEIKNIYDLKFIWLDYHPEDLPNKVTVRYNHEYVTGIVMSRCKCFERDEFIDFVDGQKIKTGRITALHEYNGKTYAEVRLVINDKLTSHIRCMIDLEFANHTRIEIVDHIMMDKLSN